MARRRPQSGFNCRVGRLAGARRGRHPALHADLPGEHPDAVGPGPELPATTTSPGRPSGGRSMPTPAARPQALQTLRRKGNGQLVYNADEFRWAQVVLAGQGSRSRRTTCTRTASSSGASPRPSRRPTRPMDAGVAVRAGPPAAAPTTRRPDRRRLLVQQDPLRLRPDDQHVSPGRHRARSTRSTRRPATGSRRRTS